MPDEFLDEVRKSRVPQPTQRNFDLEKWHKAYNAIRSHTNKDDNIYKAGIWFFNKFETIRAISNDLDLHSIPQDKLVRYIVGELLRMNMTESVIN